MAMTKKDFELIARMVNNRLTQEGLNGTACISKRLLVEDFVEELQYRYPRFDAAKFREECGL